MDLRKKIEVTQFFNGETLDFDPDSSPETFEYYINIYKNHFNLLNEFDTDDYIKTSTDCIKRLHFPIKEDSILRSDLGNLFKISGDCDFNFNEKKFYLFVFLLTDNDEYLRKLNDFYKNRHHSLINMSIMPTTGGLNLVKGNINNQDRFDKFIYELYKYFNNEKNEILSRCRANKESLKFYLSYFNNDIYQYCREIYFIYDKNLVDDLIESGKKEVTFQYPYTTKFNKTKEENKVFLINYMNLAERYWSEKEKNIKNHLKSQTQ
ncbi:hypothetical protein [Macrococcoides caseolyticum]|uniref:hypothetical protein n=1 Tax=Macrococcoides caseolyticum TaxID=69966 RepID=UPI000C33AB29|nr:hypothetical protein [Macrococcus caseolyticus]PKE62224.1 hypothetical protein CW683_11390 [Macrococcus caseolyticus]PKF44313.1 hypothetical protein CW664_11520 [Macrococcus caseolyticus]